MNRSAISPGRNFGILIGLDYSWFLIFGLLTWSLATSYFPAEVAGWPVTQYWLFGAVTVILMFISVLLHELGHSVVALCYKIPVRSIKLFIFGGIAQIGAEPPKRHGGILDCHCRPVHQFSVGAFLCHSATRGWMEQSLRCWRLQNIWPISTARWDSST